LTRVKIRALFATMPRRSSHKPKTTLTQADYVALASYRYALRRFLHFSTERARSAGISQQQYQVLLAIKALPAGEPPSVGDLAEVMQIRHHSAVGLLDRLKRRGLIKRLADAEDGRRVRVRLSASGERLLNQLAAVHRDELRRLGPELVKALQALGV